MRQAMPSPQNVTPTLKDELMLLSDQSGNSASALMGIVG